MIETFRQTEEHTNAITASGHDLEQRDHCSKRVSTVDDD